MCRRCGTGDKRTSPPARHRRRIALEIARTCSERDVPATCLPCLLFQISFRPRRERVARPPSPSGVRAASAPDREDARDCWSSMHWRPPRRHPEYTAAMSYRSTRNRLVHSIRELGGCETPQDGDDAIVSSNGMKSKGKREEPQSRRRDPAPVDVAYDDANSSDTIHLAQQRGRIVSSEVMQHLRAHHDIDAVVREGQTTRVGTHGDVD